jgi:NDP-sugar pyrophosphorylase family protein
MEADPAAGLLPVAILAGGLATRLRPITERIPKALVPVAGEPFIAHQLRLLYRAGLREVVLCVGHLGAMIEAEIGTGADYGMRVQYAFDGPTLLGTGGALRRALPLLGPRFYVLYGDSFLPIDYRAPATAWLASGLPAAMTVFRNQNAWDTSNALFKDGALLTYSKHFRHPEMHHIDYGLGLFEARIFEPYPRDTPFDLATVQEKLCSEGNLFGFEVFERFYEIGSTGGLRELESLLARAATDE